MKKLKMFQSIATSLLFVLFFSISVLNAQTVIYQENFGVPSSNTLIQNYQGWQDTSVVYTGNGTCDVRTSSASNGYGQASGGGNVMINDTVKWLMLSGLNTSQHSNLSLYCGLRKTTAEDGSRFVVEVSVDSLQWERLNIQELLPTGTGTAGWYRVCFPNVPSAEHLFVRFSNVANVDYRLDDLSLVVGEEVSLQTVAQPTTSPSSGTYFQSVEVTISCATPQASVFYTTDGTTPSAQSLEYHGPFSLYETTVVKVIAVADSMYDSEVTTVNYVVIDTNSLVELPFDIATNSRVAHLDITQLSGFRGYNLGSSYADGSAKFEASQAGRASLVAHLDSAPGNLEFDMKGKNGGSNPAAYEGIVVEVDESPDGQSWTMVAHLTEYDISIDDYIHFTGYTLLPETRYVRWKLISAEKGNTQLNNIKIDRYVPDSVAVLDYTDYPIAVYPNPTNDVLNVMFADELIEGMALHALDGTLLEQWSSPVQHSISLAGYAPGMYILRMRMTEGFVEKKVVKY